MKALEFVIDATPKATYRPYAQLAVLAHGAKQTRKATLAADKAARAGAEGASAKTLKRPDQGRQQQLDAAGPQSGATARAGPTGTG